MITIDVRSNLGSLVKDLRDDVISQVPFATAKALTDTAKEAQLALTSAIATVFDRPTPFTQRAIGITIARKTTLTARIFIKDIQAQYLGLEVTGGTRRPKARALVIPSKQLPLNQYGNIPQGKIKALLARADTFSGTVRGVPGIWQRTRTGLKLLVLWEPTAKYRKRFPFYEIVQRVIRQRIDANFKSALAFAIRTKR